MKRLAVTLLLLFAFLAMFPLSQTVSGDSTQLSSNLTLTYLDVHLSYPSEILPNQAVTVSVQATAKERVRIISLIAQVYFAEGNTLRLLGTAELAKNVRLDRGDQVNKDVQVTVPLDAPRTSLIAVVTENVRITYYSYDYAFYYPYYWNYSYFYYPPYFVYPSYGPTDVTDNAVAPLSYVKATTPEYVSLQSEYQMIESKLNQTLAENQKLQQDIQSQQNTINEKNAVITDLNQQIVSAQNTVRMLQLVALILVGVVVALVVVVWKVLSRSPQENTTAAAEPSDT